MTLKLESFNNVSDPIISDTKKKISDKAFSDIIDKEGNQYVNLVQKGGGVLGIALVGYTRVLEGCGIRFLRLAGTSAGAINTAIISISEKPKSEIRSDEVIEVMAEMEFFKFVDGNKIIKWLIKIILKNKYFFRRIKSIITKAVIIYFVLLFLTIGFNMFFKSFNLNSYLNIFLAFISIIFLLVFILMYKGITRFKNKGMGLNPGIYFFNWIKYLFDCKQIDSVSKLKYRASLKPELMLRKGITHNLGVSQILSDVTFISSELVTQNKIEFPAMIDLFRTKDKEDSLHPAAFVRASMSVPLFFDSFYIEGIRNDNDEIKKRWLELFNEKHPPKVARMVDGGILSDFPMSIFYRSDIRTPRMPTFGIDLDDSDPNDKHNNATSWSLEAYIIRLFNTARYYYDKEFLLKNKMYLKGVGKVQLNKFNWLNFFMSDKDKLALYEQGALAAKEFLVNFNWNDYKIAREDYHDTINNVSK